MTTTLTPFEEEKMREFNEHPRIRVILEIIGCQKHGADFEKYVGLWTMLHNDDEDVIQQFIREALHQQREMMRKEVEAEIKVWVEAKDWGEGWNCGIKKAIAILSNKECACACHENKLRKPYEHSGKCCERMNGFLDDIETKQ